MSTGWVNKECVNHSSVCSHVINKIREREKHYLSSIIRCAHLIMYWRDQRWFDRFSLVMCFFFSLFSLCSRSRSSPSSSSIFMMSRRVSTRFRAPSKAENLLSRVLFMFEHGVQCRNCFADTPERTVEPMNWDVSDWSVWCSICLSIT